ncbi:hypothetical protein CEXT_405411 [Caerostris extrusa]|uniref:Uncharacterized protein n=1 Tax=Caerostris extrusa TaxID=172846 RepID=A0AAV4NVD8_CAEEX|nr:hypothetical protein CEXT_405411 [Caerostris extrusa]
MGAVTLKRTVLPSTSVGGLFVGYRKPTLNPRDRGKNYGLGFETMKSAWLRTRKAILNPHYLGHKTSELECRSVGHGKKVAVTWRSLFKSVAA